MEASTKNYHCLPLWFSFTTIVTVTASALVKTYSPYTNDPITIYVQSTNLLDEHSMQYNPDQQLFYDCLKEEIHHSCLLILIEWNNRIYYAESFKTENVVNIYNNSSYNCKLRFVGQHYQFVCEKSNFYCFNCIESLFQINWFRSDEYLKDENLLNCSSNLNLCTSYIKRITTSPATLNVVSSASSQSWTNGTTVNYTVTAILNYSTTVIPKTTPLENKPPSETKIIIASVVVGVCLLFGIVIVMYCVRKRLLTKKAKSSKTCALNGKRKSNTSSMIDVPSTKTLDNATHSSYTIYGHAYDQYDLNYNTQGACSALSTSSDSYNTPDQIPNMSYSNVLTTARPVKVVYQNAKSENKNETQIKDYARLGDHVRQCKNDYNCLCPEDEANQLEVSKDLQKIQLKDLDLMEYSLAHQCHEAIDKESSTPYTLSQII
ncbi:hypothetical protein BgiBS90_029067 [Biomphalaria glabrata]|nr:hypothetical protein BgiBS90_029067 [Biomphalaria glabrata]